MNNKKDISNELKELEGKGIKTKDILKYLVTSKG